MRAAVLLVHAHACMHPPTTPSHLYAAQQVCAGRTAAWRPVPLPADRRQPQPLRCSSSGCKGTGRGGEAGVGARSTPSHRSLQVTSVRRIHATVHALHPSLLTLSPPSHPPRLWRATWTSRPASSPTWRAPAPSTATPSAATRPRQTRLSWRAGRRWRSWRGATRTSCAWWCTTAARGAAATQASHRYRGVRGTGARVFVAAAVQCSCTVTHMLPACLTETTQLNCGSQRIRLPPPPTHRWTRSMLLRTCCWVPACLG
jgi:hypothetical protein